MFKKVIKVPMPVRGLDIDISACFDLVETKVFQRLREIKQMGTVYLVFPGATHTRFEHSLGALYFSRRIANAVGLREYDRNLLEITALLHDIAHGPYSHVSETVLQDIFKIDHNQKVIEALKNVRDEIETNCGDFDKVYNINFEDLLSVFKRENVLWKLVWTLIGADKLDYLPRDYFRCGFGIPETDRILTYLHFKNGTYGVDEKAKEVLKDYIYQWWLLHREIALRKPCQIVGAMLQRAIYFSIKSGLLKAEDVWHLDDRQLDAQLSNIEVPIAQKIYHRISVRDLLKTVAVLKLFSYKEVERIADKTIYVQEMNNEDYQVIVNKYSSLFNIVKLENALTEKFRLDQGDLIVCHMPEIVRLESPSPIQLFFRSEQKFKLSVFEVYPRLLDLLREEMRAHYAFRVAVPSSERKKIFTQLKQNKTDLVELIS